MRQAQISEGEYYHIYTRGTRKLAIFHDDRDYVRFVFLLLHSHGAYYPTNLSRQVNYFARDGQFKVSADDQRKISDTRKSEVNAFALMPNHLHLLLKETQEGGISNLMQRVLNAYAKYYNEKYEQTGHLFQGRFGRVHIADNDQLLHTSAYIHRNPRELRGWKNKESTYPWSSLQDYVHTNRWGKLLNQKLILGQFKQQGDYDEYVKTNTSKDYNPDSQLLDLLDI